MKASIRGELVSGAMAGQQPAQRELVREMWEIEAFGADWVRL
ncbi:MAG: hypothetical protein AAF560_02200 [Acidobacteriota bacterium]